MNSAACEKQSKQMNGVHSMNASMLLQDDAYVFPRQGMHHAGHPCLTECQYPYLASFANSLVA